MAPKASQSALRPTPRTRPLKGNIPGRPLWQRVTLRLGSRSQGAALGTNGKHRLALAKARGFLLYLSLVLKHHYNATGLQNRSRGTVVASVNINLHRQHPSTSNCPAIVCTASVPHGSSSHGRITSKVRNLQTAHALEAFSVQPHAALVAVSVPNSNSMQASTHAPAQPIQLRSRHCMSLWPGEFN